MRPAPGARPPGPLPVGCHLQSARGRVTSPPPWSLQLVVDVTQDEMDHMMMHDQALHARTCDHGHGHGHDGRPSYGLKSMERAYDVDLYHKACASTKPRSNGILHNTIVTLNLTGHGTRVSPYITYMMQRARAWPVNAENIIICRHGIDFS